MVPLSFPALQAPVHRLCNCNGLRQRQADGRVDADSTVGGFLDCDDTRAGSCDFNDHVRSQPAEPNGLSQYRVGVALVPGISLDRETAVPSFLSIKDRLEQFGSIR